MNTTMKLLLKITIVTTLLLSVSCKDKNEQSNTSNSSSGTSKSEGLTFSDAAIDKQFQHYIHLKTALVNSDIKEAKSGAKMLMEHTSDAGLSNLLSEISKSDDIETVRNLFSDVTEKMTPIIENSISGGEVYKQFCSMAFNNQGGYWLSNKEEIRNPYFGDKMLKCGKVAKTIKK